MWVPAAVHRHVPDGARRRRPPAIVPGTERRLEACRRRCRGSAGNPRSGRTICPVVRGPGWQCDPTEREPDEHRRRPIQHGHRAHSRAGQLMMAVGNPIPYRPHGSRSDERMESHQPVRDRAARARHTARAENRRGDRPPAGPVRERLPLRRSGGPVRHVPVHHRGVRGLVRDRPAPVRRPRRRVRRGLHFGTAARVAAVRAALRPEPARPARRRARRPERHGHGRRRETWIGGRLWRGNPPGRARPRDRGPCRADRGGRGRPRRRPTRRGRLRRRGRVLGPHLRRRLLHRRSLRAADLNSGVRHQRV